jgi:hypothetical protein
VPKGCSGVTCGRAAYEIRRDAKALWDYFDLVWSSFAEERADWLGQHGAEYELADDRRESLD